MPEPLAQKTTKVLDEGAYFPLGATVSAEGVNFALYSKNAAAGSCSSSTRPTATPDRHHPSHAPRQVTSGTACVHGLRPGQLYGYKVGGDVPPESGLRFNDAKLLLDPYAKAVTGKFRNIDNLLLAYDPGAGAAMARPMPATTRAIVPKAIVVDDASTGRAMLAAPRSRAAGHLRSARRRDSPRIRLRRSHTRAPISDSSRRFRI